MISRTCCVPKRFQLSVQSSSFWVHQQQTSQYLVLLFVFSVLLVSLEQQQQQQWGSGGSVLVDGFAYAPNFITKIIEEQTAIKPRGLLQIVADSGVLTTTSTTSSKTTATATIVKPIETIQQKQQQQIVKTRFPPEPNGYLHLGHAKAVSFNFAVARAFQGVCHMRLDDTNPSKEEQEYVDSILEDVQWIQSGLYETNNNNNNSSTNVLYPWDGPVRKTSDYFQLIYDCAMELIKQGDAYVDSLSMEEMRQYRGTLTEPGMDSPYRNRSIDENVRLFQEMKDGLHPDGTYVVRAKINMQAENINLRDPALYRIKHESHQATGSDWCIYPMYDFSHPISDSIEDITHSLCTLEFEDHRPFYDWTLEKLIPTGLLQTKSQQIEFSRLNIKSTVLSKRKLIQLVTDKYVKGWDDPRMPTLCGLRRRGVPPSALRLFCERVGISKADSNIDYNVLEDCIREVMDTSCPRAFCVLNPLKVTITNYELNNEEFVVDKHPKISEMGQRNIPFSSTVYIERDDFFDTTGPEGHSTNGVPPKGFKRLLLNEQVRLRYAYVIECTEVLRDPDTNEPKELKCIYYPTTRAGITPPGMKRVNGIIHWVDGISSIPCMINQYDRLFCSDEPGKDQNGDFLKDMNPNSLQILKNARIEPSVVQDVSHMMKRIQEQQQQQQQGSLSITPIYPSTLAYQFERSGYFALDKDTTDTNQIIFNRVVTLRDTWGSGGVSSSSVTTTTTSTSKTAPTTSSERTRGTTTSGTTAATEPIEDIRRVAFKVATIVSATSHPDSDQLIVCQVDCGDQNNDDDATADAGTIPLTRTVVAGLANKIPLNELIGQKVVAVTNLKPAKLVGIESTAMLLAAASTKDDDDDATVVELLQVPDSVPNGELLFFENMEPNVPDVQMKSKGAIKAWERAKALLRTNTIGEVVVVTDQPESTSSNRMMSSAGPIKTISITNSIVQ